MDNVLFAIVERGSRLESPLWSPKANQTDANISFAKFPRKVNHYTF
jgi:hypothetical protein